MVGVRKRHTRVARSGGGSVGWKLEANDHKQLFKDVQFANVLMVNSYTFKGCFIVRYFIF